MAIAPPWARGRPSWSNIVAQWLRHFAARSQDWRWNAEGAADPAPALTGAVDDATFERFFRQHESRVTGYLWRVTSDQQEARDLSQETFLRAWQHFAEIARYDRPEAWLFKVATNLALQRLRRHASPVGAATSLRDDLDAPGADPTEQFVAGDLVRQTVMDLPPQMRVLLMLREVYGWPLDDIAAAANLTRDAAKMAISRARQEFRRRYLRQEEDV